MKFNEKLYFITFYIIYPNKLNYSTQNEKISIDKVLNCHIFS